MVAGYHVSLNVGERSTTAGTAGLVVALELALTVGLALLLGLARPATATALAAMSAGDLALVLYLGVACTLAGYVGWNVGLRGLGATRAVPDAYAIPALGVTVGALTLGEAVTAWSVAGGALVLPGAALVQARGRRGQTESVPSGQPLVEDV